MNLLAILQLLLLLTAANGAPVIGKRIFGPRAAWPLDGGASFLDGRPLFGKSKTLRGVVLAAAATTALAPAIGLDWTTGLGVALLAMLGDLASSFVKRRLALPPSSMALGLDQVPESLLPLAWVAWRGDPALGWLDVAAGVVLFFVGELILSRILYRLHVRDRPY